MTVSSAHSKSSIGPRLTPPSSRPVSDQEVVKQSVQPTLSVPQAPSKEGGALSASTPSTPPVPDPHIEQQSVSSTSAPTIVAPINPEETFSSLGLKFRLLTMLLTLIVGLLVYDALISLNIFQLRQVQYQGLEHLTSEDLSDSLLLENIRPSIISPSLAMIEAAIIGHPWVRQAEAKLSWNGVIQVSVTEYRASAIAVLDELYLVTPEGLPFAPASSTDIGVNLPMISGVDPALFNSSQKASLIGRYWLRKGIELAQLVKRSRLGSSHHLSDVHISQTGRYEIMLNKIRIVLGTDMLSERLSKVEDIIDRLNRKGVTAAYILLSDDLNRAIVKESSITVDDASLEITTQDRER